MKLLSDCSSRLSKGNISEQYAKHDLEKFLQNNFGRYNIIANNFNITCFSNDLSCRIIQLATFMCAVVLHRRKEETTHILHVGYIVWKKKTSSALSKYSIIQFSCSKLILSLCGSRYVIAVTKGHVNPALPYIR